jgi:hypothetical protein
MTHRIDVEPIEAPILDRDEPIRADEERGIRDRQEILDARVVEPAPPAAGPAPSPAPSSAAGAATAPVALFPAPEAEGLRSEWQAIQTGFVDEPRRAVEHADALVSRVAQRLADVFGAERAGLEKRWGQGGDVSTEDLRLVLQRYRSFFDRLLSV